MRNILSVLLLSTVTVAVAAPPTPTSLEGKEGYERRSAIAEMADTVWENQRFSVNRGMDILRGMSGTDRYYATRTLLGENRQKRNLLPNRMTIGEIHRLLEGTEQRSALLQLLSDQGIPAAYLSATEVESLIAPLSPIDHDRALRSLLGSNRMDRNYSLPNFKPQEVRNLLRNSSDRTAMIRYFADRTLLAGTLSLEDAEQIMQQQSSMDRHDSIKALLGDNRDKQDYLKLPLQFNNTLQLLHGAALRSELLRHFANRGVYSGQLSASDAKQLLEGITQTDRFSSLKTLLGMNDLQQSYLQTPLSAEDAATLLDGIAYRDQMLGFMADGNLITHSLTTEQALQLLEGVTRADRHDALRALLGGNELDQNYLQLPLTAEATTALLNGSAYRDELIQWISDQQQLQQDLDAADTLMLIEGLVGDARYHALNSLLGNNREQRRYLANTINATEWTALLERSANRLQLLQQIKAQMPIEIESAKVLEQLLGRLYGSEREAAAKLLTH